MMPLPDIRLQNMNPNQKAEAVSVLSAFTKAQKYYHVHGIIHEGDAYIFRTTVPTIETDEIRQAVESILEENVPIPPIEAVFEYDIVSVDIMRGETTVAVSVVSEKTISAYTDLLISGGLLPISLETESRSLSRALFFPDTKGVFLVLAIMENHSVIFIAENGMAVFSSSIDIGSRDINQTFTTIRDEIEKVLVFWETQEKEIKNNISISRIMLAGSDSLIPGFARYISICFKMPVSVGSVWTNVLSPEENVPKLSQRDSLNYGPCIGSLV